MEGREGGLWAQSLWEEGQGDQATWGQLRLVGRGEEECRGWSDRIAFDFLKSIPG